ncbi:MAG: PIG-L family deacetylase [Nanoarchaeota archaeon]
METAGKIYNILFVVSHPDDEAFWVGGLISELARINFFNIYIICLSGGNSGAIRKNEFISATKTAGLNNVYISTEKLHLAENPLPSITDTVRAGMVALSLKNADLDVLITHPPFGDEHGHPHHKQAYRELYIWTKHNDIPFGYFSTALIPYFDLRPTLTNMKRFGTLQLLNLSKCRNNVPWGLRIASKSLKDFHTPSYLLQFLSSLDKKQTMLSHYLSIGLEKSAKGYCSFTNNCENLYLFDNRALAPFKILIDKMETPGRPQLFPSRIKWLNKILK